VDHLFERARQLSTLANMRRSPPIIVPCVAAAKDHDLADGTHQIAEAQKLERELPTSFLTPAAASMVACISQ
jgi:hypothetical protein